MDQGAREWLDLIESKKAELGALSQALQDTEKRSRRLTSQKSLTQISASIEAIQSEKAELEQDLQLETTNFFAEVLKIRAFSRVARRVRDVVESKVLIATAFQIQRLASGAIILTVVGDSLTNDVHAGLPQAEMLVANDSLGESLVSI